MPEDTTTTTPVAPLAGTAANSQTSTVTTPEPLAGDGTPINLEEAKKLRSEAANLRKRLKAYEDAEEQAKIAALSETQQAQAQFEKAQKQFAQYQQETESKLKAYQQQLIAAKVEVAAHALGIIDPEVAATLIASTLEKDEEGMPTNIDKALATLIKNKPYLAPKAAEPAPASPAQTAAPATPANPALPAMNQPGRRTIADPALPPGRIPRLTDTGLFKNPNS